MAAIEHRTGTRAEWREARLALLAREKELSRTRDALAAERRALPWVRVEEPYRFATVDGPRSLAELFGGRSQLIVYHFMYGPEWQDGCKSCSFWMDAFDGVVVHLAHRDTAFWAISRAPLATLERYRTRMGWRFPWASSAGSTFNLDFHVSFDADAVAHGGEYNFRQTGVGEELPGLSVFARDADGAVFHTYSTYARGLDTLNSGYQLLDLVPRGRDEAGLPSTMAWLRRRDEYGDATVG